MGHPPITTEARRTRSFVICLEDSSVTKPTKQREKALTKRASFLFEPIQSLLWKHEDKIRRDSVAARIFQSWRDLPAIASARYIERVHIVIAASDINHRAVDRDSAVQRRRSVRQSYRERRQ